MEMAGVRQTGESSLINSVISIPHLYHIAVAINDRRPLRIIRCLKGWGLIAGSLYFRCWFVIFSRM
jgi:hypothetical protein